LEGTRPNRAIARFGRFTPLTKPRGHRSSRDRKGKAITNKLLTAGTEKPMEIAHQTPAGTVTRVIGKKGTDRSNFISERK